MASFSFNDISIRDSITNPEVDKSIAKDNVTPFSFLTFITLAQVDYSPDEYNNFYIKYLKKWTESKSEKVEDQKKTFVDVYVSFLKEIVVVYSTDQERRFLTNLDFSDPNDLDVAIPFFVEKIRQIVLFYKEKRDEAKFVVTKNRIKGNKTSIEKIIFDKIYEFAFTKQDDPAFAITGDVLSRIKTDLNISILDYVDVFSNYFDIPQVLTSKQTLGELTSKQDIDTLSSSNIDFLYNKFNTNVLAEDKKIVFIGEDNITTKDNQKRSIIEDNVLVEIDNKQLFTQPAPPRRTELYSSNVNEVDISLFFTDLDRESIFGSSAFLQDLPLLANVSLEYDPICDPENPLQVLNNRDALLKGFTEEEITGLRKQLLSKYLGVDFYFYDNTQSVPVSGLLIKADAPWNNILNQQAGNVAAVNSDGIERSATLLKNVGLFFKPDKIGLFKLNASSFTYEIDREKLTENKIYVFPDPSVYGNVTSNPKDVYPLVYIYDFKPDVKNSSSGFAIGGPIVSNDEQSFTGYYSRKNTIEKNVIDSEGLNLNFTDLYNRGYITKLQYDVYGNEYALFKDEFGATFREKEDVRLDVILNLLLDGYRFYDQIEGYDFNYDVFGSYGDFIRSGIITQTVDDNDSPTLPISGYPLTLNFRDFFPYQELIRASRTIRVSFKDGGVFTFRDSTALPSEFQTDDINYPGFLNYYYELLAEAGTVFVGDNSLSDSFFSVELLRNILTEQLELLLTEDDEEIVSDDSFSIPYGSNDPTFEVDVKFAYGLVGVEEYDCGFFTDNVVLTNSYLYKDDFTYYDEIRSESKTVLSQLSSSYDFILQADKLKLAGNLFVKNQSFSLSVPYSAAMFTLFSKYSEPVKDNIFSNIIDFDIIYDSIILESERYLVIDKIAYDSDGNFAKPKTLNTVFEYVSGIHISKFSNRFFKEDTKKVMFTILTTSGSTLGSISKAIIPEIYEYDISTNKTTLLFPLNANQRNEFTNMYSLSNLVVIEDSVSEDIIVSSTARFNTNILHCDRPIITYNSLNDLYKITFKGIDNNNLFHIFDYTFFISQSQGLVFKDIRYYYHDKILRSTTFDIDDIQLVNDGLLEGASVISSTGNFNIQDNTLII
jgi:hypothetical protein